MLARSLVASGAVRLCLICFVVCWLDVLKVVDEGGGRDDSWMDPKRVEVDVDEMELYRRRQPFCRPAHEDMLSRAA